MRGTRPRRREQTILASFVSVITMTREPVEQKNDAIIWFQNHEAARPAGTSDFVILITLRYKFVSVITMTREPAV